MDKTLIKEAIEELSKGRAALAERNKRDLARCDLVIDLLRTELNRPETRPYEGE